jgi:hypothetical protein
LNHWLCFLDKFWEFLLRAVSCHAICLWTQIGIWPIGLYEPKGVRCISFGGTQIWSYLLWGFTESLQQRPLADYPFF